MNLIIPPPSELTEEMIEQARSELRETDGEPLETPWHRSEINLLIDLVHVHRTGRSDYFVGGNMFIYYSREQARSWKYKGPDFFFVDRVDGNKPRLYWWAFEEDSRLPDVIVELTSPSTAREDHTTKKDIYEQTFRTPEYYCYDPEKHRLEGWRLDQGRYRDIATDTRGWMWSEQLGLWLGKWEGTFQNQAGTWLRFYDAQGRLVPTPAERERELTEVERQRAEKERLLADSERQRAEKERLLADSERQRADALAVEVQRLKALLAGKGTQESGQPAP